MPDKISAFMGVVVGAVLATSSIARADADANAEGQDQLTLPRGRLLLDALVEINLSSGGAFKPFSITPDLWYGATDELTVGLVHSSLAASGFIGGVGDALCLSGSGSGCPDLYPGFGIDGRYRLKEPAFGFTLALDGGLFIRHIDPFQLAIKLGAAGRWHDGKAAVELSPNLFFGLTNRTPTAAAGAVAVASNQEILDLPVTGMYTVAPKIVVAAQTGLVLPFEQTGDTYAVPLSIGGLYQVDDSLNLNLAFSLPALIGGGKTTGFDARTLTLGGTYAF